MWETWVWSLGWEDPLEKRKATHSSILAWRMPWTIVHGVAKSQTRLSDALAHSLSLSRVESRHFLVLVFRIACSVMECETSPDKSKHSSWHYLFQCLQVFLRLPEDAASSSVFDIWPYHKDLERFLSFFFINRSLYEFWTELSSLNWTLSIRLINLL